MLDTYYKNIKDNISYNHSRTETMPATDFHLHDRFEIYFFISGKVNYFIEKKVYALKYGDLLIMNSHEIHSPTFQPGEPYERIVIHFNPSLVRALTPSNYDLLYCFVNRPKGEQNKINLSVGQVEDIRDIFKKLERLGSNPIGDSAVLKLSYLLELLVLINRAFVFRYNTEDYPAVPEKLIPVLDFIDGSLDSDLSLDALEQKFYMDRFYLSRLFKKFTGSSIHEYIIYKRISLAKKLLSDGMNVTEACMKCGFNDYSNFSRMFKKAVGFSPGYYKKLNVK